MMAVRGHPVWDEIAPEITPEEFRAPWEMRAETLLRLSRIRRRSGVPFRIVSDYRSPERNAAAGGVRRSAHTEIPGRAVDLRVHDSSERYRLVRAAWEEGVTRVGVYEPTPGQRRRWGRSSGSVHLDDSVLLPSERLWVLK